MVSDEIRATLVDHDLYPWVVHEGSWAKSVGECDMLHSSCYKSDLKRKTGRQFIEMHQYHAHVLVLVLEQIFTGIIEIYI